MATMSRLWQVDKSNRSSVFQVSRSEDKQDSDFTHDWVMFYHIVYRGADWATKKAKAQIILRYAGYRDSSKPKLKEERHPVEVNIVLNCARPSSGAPNASQMVVYDYVHTDPITAFQAIDKAKDWCSEQLLTSAELLGMLAK